MSIVNIKYTKSNIFEEDKETAIIEAQNLAVKYIVGSKREDVQSRTFNTLLRRQKKAGFWALKDVSFKIFSEDILGIIGLNGAGKTTLCRVISGLLRPDVGKIRVEGKISALLSLGTGFNPNLSGRENVFLNGMMLGFSKRCIKDLFDEIVAFSGLEDFIDQPLKRYSSGMKSRLAFSIAAMIEPEIFIIDEALRAGDLAFSEKAGEKLQQIIGKSKVVIVVTHQISFVERYCTKGLWLDSGKVRAYGRPEEITELYKKFAIPSKKRIKILNLNKTESTVGNSKIVKAENIGLKYPIMKQKNSNNNKFGVRTQILRKMEKAFWALKDVSFTVNEGEILGIIGSNGAGKTTLCRIMGGILKPDKGNIVSNGKITALLTLRTGFNIQLSGKDNIYLNGMILGISKRELKNLYFDIVEFSGLKRVIDQPVKTYSSGMKSRLGFSIAATIKPDVFIIDEVLSAGDISFNEKAITKIQELIEKAKAVIVVTHNMPFVEKVCTRALWLDDGNVNFDGRPKEAVEMYSNSVRHSK